MGLNTTAVFVITIAIQLVGFIATVFLSHGVGGETNGKTFLGIIQLFLIISSSVNTLGELRISSAYQFFVARGQSPTQLARTFLLARTAMVFAAGVFLIVFAYAYPSLAEVQNAPGVGESELLEIFTVFMVLPLLWSIQTVYTASVTAQGDSLGGQIPLLLESVVRTSVLLLVAVPIYLHPTASVANPQGLLWEMTYAYIAGASASALYSAPRVLRYRGSFVAGDLRRMFRYAWPLMGSLGLLYLSNSATPLFVAGYFGPALLNIFSVANGFRIFALAVPAAVAVPLFPHLSGLHSKQEYDLVRDQTWKSLRYTAMLIVPGVVALIVYRVPVLNIYNSSYVPLGQVPLAILVASTIPAALSQLIGTSLSAVGYQRLELYLTTLQVAIMLGGFALLLPPISLFHLEGLIAVSVAVLTSAMAALALNAVFMYRLLGVHIQPRPILTILLSAAASFAAVSLLNRFVESRGIVALLGLFVLGFVVYFFVLAAVGELSREDVLKIGGSLGLPRRLVQAFSRLCWRTTSPPVNPIPASGAPALRPLDPKYFSPPPPRPPPKGPQG